MDNLSFKYEQTKYILLQKIKELFENDCSGHDYWHSLRVLNNADKIAKTEKCDEYIVMIAALLHDTDDIKIFETRDYENARRIMLDCHLTDSTIERVIDIIREISFKGTETVFPKSIETEYRNHEGTTINHFYEKLLLIKDMMNGMDNTEERYI